MKNKQEILHDIFTMMQMLNNPPDFEQAMFRAAEEIGFENLPIKLLLAFKKHLMSGE